ncbi:amidohydrolase family protein [Actinocrispum sp. NPDC049592]|uniref:amidohydrolase family protein n=1 Tax=Actinocrispum sp. NPDC049592 TaxID=3154835 RepID=UPI00343162D4
MRDGDVAQWVAGLGLPGLVDLHVHFLPEPVLRKVWAYFDNAREHYGMDWPVHYRFDEDERVRILHGLGVVAFAPLVYPHKPGMAEWLNDWVRDFAASTPGAVPTATLFPEPGVETYLARALADGARCVKAHVQVGAYDPRASELDTSWGLIAEAGVPLVIHCGHGPRPGAFTGLDVFEEVLKRHPRLTAVLAHAGMPDFDLAFDLVERYPNVHIDTTMVGVDFTDPLPDGFISRLAGHADRIALGTDFPNIPYEYARQIDAIAGWAEANAQLGDSFLRAVLHDTPARLLGLTDQADLR